MAAVTASTDAQSVSETAEQTARRFAFSHPAPLRSEKSKKKRRASFGAVMAGCPRSSAASPRGAPDFRFDSARGPEPYQMSGEGGLLPAMLEWS